MKFGVVLPLAAGKAPVRVAACGAPTLTPPVAGSPVEDGALPEDEPASEEVDEVGSEEPDDVEPDEVDELDPDDVLDEPEDELDVEPEL